MIGVSFSWDNLVERFNLDTARLRAVINKAADAAGWHQPLPAGDDKTRHGRGIAACYNQGAWVAEVVEVTASEGKLRTDKVVAAIDCGRVINPQGAVAQVEGSIIDGSSAALHQASAFELSVHCVRVDGDVHISRQAPFLKKLRRLSIFKRYE